MEPLKHECGIALVRLLKPLSYYQEKYGTWMYGLNKLYLLMEKQHNRGQEGAGFAAVKQHAAPGEEYLYRQRAEGSNAIAEIFSDTHRLFADYTPEQLSDAVFAQEHIPFAGECYMGHLRYSTTGKSGLSFVHPMIRRSNWRARTLAICGNFNLTNVDAIFDAITSKGQHPRVISDMHILLEQIGHRLDREVERVYTMGRLEHNLHGMDITHYIEEKMDLAQVLRKAAPLWDGGFVMCGLTGSGEMYAVRDAHGIRPAFYYLDDEIAVIASERPVIQTVMNVTHDAVQELQPGQSLLINQRGETRLEQILAPDNLKACSFERIYFSRGSDVDIYKERKKLGYLLAPKILQAIDNDLDHSVFSFVPNTAEVAYYGMVEGLNDHLNREKLEAIKEKNGTCTPEELSAIINRRVRVEKVAIKDIKLRTFIAEGNSRNDLAAHVYDVTYGSIEYGKDNLVIIDDSIVRGTTIKQSILKILDRIGPKLIVIVSSSPQIRYPDCYGIDMSRMKEFIAFRAAIALHEERATNYIIEQQYREALGLRKVSRNNFVPNVVKAIYKPFSPEEISEKIVELVKPKQLKAEVKIVFQSIEGLHDAIPNHPGDWYFTGNFPTPGGAHLVNEAFINYVENDWHKE
ncbi:amidophosphoribosyltransferase [uncultured Porphyromonas sp.]|jgi:putative amidophosphoribosyltransferase|uniref:amidophosphoribosyltransferase n=1 Tax=uncultured Porphyromonas sp. TaxID=159274 RepID=UPI00261FAE3B|nr:amidophosphoribosyltransferase [uncultured Porphyromonas sp.]